MLIEPPQAKPLVQRGWLRVLVFAIPYLLVMLAFQLMALAVISQLAGIGFLETATSATLLHELNNFLVLEFFLMIGSFLIVWLFTRWIEKKPLISIGLQIKDKSDQLFFGIAAGAIIMGLGVVILKLLSLYDVAKIEFVSSTFFSSIFLCVFISVSEEVVVRGYILRNLMHSFPKYMALIISALLFALLHAFNPNLSIVGMINLFIAGLLLGASYIFTKNLWFPIGLHFGWNFFQGPIFGFNVSGIDLNALIIQEPLEEQLWSGGNFGFEGSLLASIISIAALIMVIAYFKPAHKESPDQGENFNDKNETAS